jgi:hypothetical protein
MFRRWPGPPLLSERLSRRLRLERLGGGRS